MMDGHNDIESLLARDREDEIKDLREFTEDDYAFLEEQRQLMEEFR